MLTKRVSFYRRQFVLGFTSLSRRPGRRSRRPAIADAVRLDARRGLKAAPAGGRGGLAGCHWRLRRAPGTQASSKWSAPRPSSSSSRRAGWSWLSSFEHEKRLRSSAARSVDIVAMLVESAHAARLAAQDLCSPGEQGVLHDLEEDAAVRGGEVFAANRQKRAARARGQHGRARAKRASRSGSWRVGGRGTAAGAGH